MSNNRWNRTTSLYGEKCVTYLEGNDLPETARDVNAAFLATLNTPKQKQLMFGDFFEERNSIFYDRRESMSSNFTTTSANSPTVEVSDATRSYRPESLTVEVDHSSRSAGAESPEIEAPAVPVRAETESSNTDVVAETVVAKAELPNVGAAAETVVAKAESPNVGAAAETVVAKAESPNVGAAAETSVAETESPEAKAATKISRWVRVRELAMRTSRGAGEIRKAGYVPCLLHEASYREAVDSEHQISGHNDAAFATWKKRVELPVGHKDRVEESFGTIFLLRAIKTVVFS